MQASKLQTGCFNKIVYDSRQMHSHKSMIHHFVPLSPSSPLNSEYMYLKFPYC